jgi:coenzyme PQQ synthesis protein D (PqqD)
MPGAQDISMTAVVCASPGQVSRDLGGEAVVLQLTSGRYYALDPVGARIWNLLQQPISVQQLLDTILAEYEVDPAQCQSDILALLKDLAAERLINLRDGIAS